MAYTFSFDSTEKLNDRIRKALKTLRGHDEQVGKRSLKEALAVFVGARDYQTLHGLVVQQSPKETVGDNGLPVLVVCRGGVVQDTVLCKDGQELEDRFADEFLHRGIEPTDIDFDNGYAEFEDGCSVSMTWSFRGETQPSGRRTL